MPREAVRSFRARSRDGPRSKARAHDGGCGVTRIAFGIAIGVASTLAAIVALARPFVVAAIADGEQRRSLLDAQDRLAAWRGGVL